SMSVWFSGSFGLIAMPETPETTGSSTMDICSSAVPWAGMRNTTSHPSSCAAFSVQACATFQTSEALFVTYAPRTRAPLGAAEVVSTLLAGAAESLEQLVIHPHTASTAAVHVIRRIKCISLIPPSRGSTLCLGLLRRLGIAVRPRVLPAI